MRKIKILLIDDNEDHVKLIQRYLEEAGAIVISPPFLNDLRDIKEQIENEKPTDIFVDYFYPDNCTLEDILEDIGTELFFDKRIWVISGYDISVREMIELRQEWPNIQNAWIAKPFSKDEIFSLLAQIQLTHKKKKNLLNDLNRIKSLYSIPLPIRLYETKTKKITTNKAWPMASNRPDIPDLSDIQDDSPHKTTYWHHTDESHSGRGGMYNIQSFMIPEQPEIIWQTATKIDAPKHSLIDLVELIFETMKAAGFPRGRFYRIIDVPDSNIPDNIPSGQVEIVLRTGDGYPDREIPTSYPIGGFWRKRIKSAGENVDREKLNYHILISVDKKISRTKDFQFWNDFHNIFDSVKNSLEVPIFKKFHGKFKSIGSFCFDKFEPGVAKEDTVIRKEDIALVENTLKTMILDVRKKIIDEKKIHWHELYEELDKIDDRIKKKKDLKTALQMILDESLKLVGAKSGIIAFRPGNANYLEVIERSSSPVLQGFALSLNSDILNVRSWRNKQEIFYPNFQKNRPRYETVKDIFKNDATRKNNFARAIKKIGSCVTLPILIDDTVIGAITLHHSDPYFFDNQKVHALKILLKRGKWFLQIKMRENERGNREGLIIHEIRSLTRDLKLNFNSLDFKETKYTDKYKGSVRFDIQSLLDLSAKYSILKSGFNDKKSKKINLWPLLYEITELYHVRMDFKRLKIKKDSNQNITLKGDETSFALVLRTILSNAVKFAPRSGKISISVKKKEMCKITISNTGAISEESEKLAFTPDIYLIDDTKDGLHMGLASAKKIVEFYGGEISIDNDEKKENVIVSFTWPIAEEG